MKRSQALTELSREHHSALVLAKRAQRLAADANSAAVHGFVTSLPAIFAAELEPHFRIEEQRLLPALRQAGVGPAVQRTVAEHDELRTLARQLGDGEFASLARFGTLLEAHVRFEERELFALAEQALPPQVLADAMNGGAASTLPE